ncbi:hypothetical protein IAG44_35105 [Streptomyces roseirectus]|uniref:Uncharacterized protein n=1 Tax=Streptomyces roseirectus TaxID=2768066 RepID=A0A7H0IN03_9ACTN|nr:hypothetical protein [Streptomyces roseirectus]QNP74169.1 hypothetical protein IAG44_35105 [Streptomyces roseirectus]
MSPQQQDAQSAPTIQEVRSSTAQDEAGRPALLPPGVNAGLAGGALGGAGKPAGDAMVQRFELNAAGEARPTLTPELHGELRAFAAITGTWTQNVTVDGLWSINQTRNAFFRVKGGGWKKIYNATDWSFTALTTLASQARQTSRPISFREEADGMVHEIYLW